MCFFLALYDHRISHSLVISKVGTLVILLLMETGSLKHRKSKNTLSSVSLKIPSLSEQLLNLMRYGTQNEKVSVGWRLCFCALPLLQEASSITTDWWGIQACCVVCTTVIFRDSQACFFPPLFDFSFPDFLPFPLFFVLPTSLPFIPLVSFCCQCVGGFRV